MVRESEQLRFLRDLLFKILAGIVSTSGGAPSAALIDLQYKTKEPLSQSPDGILKRA